MAVGWKGERRSVFAGGCNEDRRLSGIWHTLLAYDDGSGGSRHGRGRAHARRPVTRGSSGLLGQPEPARERLVIDNSSSGPLARPRGGLRRAIPFSLVLIGYAALFSF